MSRMYDASEHPRASNAKLAKRTCLLLCLSVLHLLVLTGTGTVSSYLQPVCSLLFLCHNRSILGEFF